MAIIEAVEQTEMFKEDKRRRDLMYAIPEAYSVAQRALPAIGESAKFFKTFSEYAKSLEVEKDRQTVIDNLKVAKTKAGDLLEIIQRAEKSLIEAQNMEEEITGLEVELGIEPVDRWLYKRSMPAQSEVESSYLDDDKLDELEVFSEDTVSDSEEDEESAQI